MRCNYSYLILSKGECELTSENILEEENLNVLDGPGVTAKSVPDKYLQQHQQDAVDSLNKYFDLNGSKPDQNGLLVMPTGSGKLLQQ